jgi:hypothetical protein
MQKLVGAQDVNLAAVGIALLYKVGLSRKIGSVTWERPVGFFQVD